MHEKVIVALDLPATEALTIARKLHGHASWMKVGLTLFYAEGPQIVTELKAMGFKVFLDLKLFDIPHQVQGAAASLTRIGVDMFNLHALGAPSMMQAAREGAKLAADELGILEPLILGVTVLTSMDQSDLTLTGIDRPVDQQVSSLAALCQQASLDGVVASPLETEMLRAQLAPEALIVTPGVRPAGSDTDDQSRVATPGQALISGASHIVVGRPITAAPDPLVAFQTLFV
jgi:orotidine-5'-phosphate decarboxylase